MAELSKKEVVRSRECEDEREGERERERGVRVRRERRLREKQSRIRERERERESKREYSEILRQKGERQEGGAGQKDAWERDRQTDRECEAVESCLLSSNTVAGPSFHNQSRPCSAYCCQRRIEKHALTNYPATQRD